MSFISCNEYKDSSIYKFNVQFNILRILKNINFSPNHKERFFWGKISPNFDLKIQFQPTYKKNFMQKMARILFFKIFISRM